MNKTTWCQTTLKTQKWKQTEHQRYNHFNNNSFCLPFINFLMCVKMLQRFVYKTYQSSRIYNPKHLFLQILSIASFVVWNKLLAILQMSCCTSSFKTNHDSVNSSVNHLQQNNCFSCSWCFEEECAVRQRRGVDRVVSAAFRFGRCVQECVFGGAEAEVHRAMDIVVAGCVGNAG